jgi:hypothetical protein
MLQLYADVWAMDLGHWPANSTVFVTKPAGLGKLKSRTEVNRYRVGRGLLGDRRKPKILADQRG